MANKKNQELNKLRAENKKLWETIRQNSEFRHTIGDLLFTMDDLKHEFKFKTGTVIDAVYSPGHPDLMPKVIERIKALIKITTQCSHSR